ncbi:MAG: hypothetical protein ACXVBJ_06735 [Flavisolibacter sp.]
MKKFLGILAIAGVLVACNNSGSSTTSADSTKTDSAAMNSIPPATTDTTVKVDTTVVKVDTTKKTADSATAKKVKK